MKLSTVYSYAVIGVEAKLIHIEVHIANGLPGLSIVGLPEASVRESKDRVRSAIQNAGFEYPARRITVNLAPADLPKFGAGYDLPIAIGILHASDQLKDVELRDYALIGELSLSGEIRPVGGILPVAVEASNQGKQLILPAENLNEVKILSEQETDSAQYHANSLLAVCGHLVGEQLLTKVSGQPEAQPKESLCLSDVQGQHQAKRVLEIAAAGGHSLLMQGPPGTGKTMLASRLPSILPTINTKEAVEVASIYSAAQVHRDSFNEAPFRSPHHTASPTALVGGGSRPIPGEISLAHRGVLFLDELTEFPSKVLEVMRQPLESGEIWVSRASLKTVFPSRFQLIAAMNPCPCGYAGEARCSCTTDRINRYQSRISGPLLDRIDLHIKLDRTQQQIRLQGTKKQETSQSIRQRVTETRARQLVRQSQLNSELDERAIQKYLSQDRELRDTAEQAIKQMDLSMRALHRAFKVALTIADLASEPIQKIHLMESLSYRQTFPV